MVWLAGADTGLVVTCWVEDGLVLSPVVFIMVVAGAGFKAEAVGLVVEGWVTTFAVGPLA